jgi:hypothetical protein
VSTLFFVYNPFSLELFANGDFYYFIFESFFLIALVCLTFYFKSRAKKHEIFVLSLFFLTLSASFNDVFYIGIFEYFLFGVILLYFFRWTNFIDFLRSSIKFSLMMILLIPISLPILLGIFYGPIPLNPSSPLALPVSTYINNGIGVFNTIIMKSYPPNVSWSSLSAYSSILSAMWSVLLVILILFAFLIGFFYKNMKAILFALLSIGSALFASGSKGPFASILIWAYSHIYGFQLLNYPYIITWLLSTIFYSLLFAIDIELFSTLKPNKDKIFQIKFSRNLLNSVRNPLKLIFIILIVVVISIPIAGQGFYGENGIHSVEIPSSYNELTTKLKELDQNSYFGVALFNPSSYLFFNNSTSNRFNNPVIYDSPVRTPAIPGYITQPLPSYNFFNWAYYEFYSNSTKYFPEIMASVGYKYFVDLFNTNSADFYPLYMTHLTMNVNASKILSHQFGISKISMTRAYSIYQYDSNFSLVNKVSKYSLFAGNYNLLTISAKYGLNLLKIVPLFTPDTLRLNISSLLNNTSSIVEFNSNGVKDLILSHSPNYHSIFDISDVTQPWSNSFSQLTDWYVNEVAQTSPFLETSSNASIKIPINPNESGMTVWIKVLESDVPNNLFKVTIGNEKLAEFSTFNETLNSNTTGFIWLKVNLPQILTNTNLDLTFNGSYNGIESYSIEPDYWFQNNLRCFDSIVLKKNITIVNLENESNYQLYNIFKNGSSIYGITPLDAAIVPEENGFSISGVQKGDIFIRIPWNGFCSDFKNISTISAFDSMGTITSIPFNLSYFKLISSDFYIQIYGYVVSISTIVVCVSLSIFMRKKMNNINQVKN